MARKSGSGSGGGMAGGGVIPYVFTSIILIVLMGFISGVMVNSIPLGSDNFGIAAAIATYGPLLVTMLFVMLMVVVIAGMLRYFGVIGA